MCLNPIVIPNKRVDLRSCDPLYFEVPCGHCEQCLLTKRNDWFVRLYYEFKAHNEKLGGHGCTVFPTFTYNDDFLPKFNILDEKYKPLEQFAVRPVLPPMVSFDKERVQKAFKKFRMRLFRLFGDSKIKYFCVCEYGEQFGRPHYHIPMFFPYKFNDMDIKNMLEYAWSERILKSDPIFSENKKFQNFVKSAKDFFKLFPQKSLYVPFGTKKDEMYKYIASKTKDGKILFFRKVGNVSFSKDFGAFVESSDALSYVVKYLDKGSSSFFDSDNAKSLLSFAKSLPPYSTIENPGLASLVKEVNDVFPFTLSSNELGAELCDDLDIRTQLADSYKKCLENEILPNKVEIEGEYYAIPKYITDRLFFEVRNVPRYYTSGSDDEFVYTDITKKRFLTKLGVEVYKLRAEFKRKEAEKNYQLYLNPDWIALLKGCCDSIMLSEKALTRLENLCADFWYLKKTFLVDYTLLSYYSIFFHNVPFDYRYPIQPDKEGNFLQSVKDVSNYIMCERVYTFNDYQQIINRSDFYDLFHYVRHWYSDFAPFEGYERIVSYVNKLRSFVTYLKFEYSRQKVSQNLGDILTNFINSHLYV